jgi:hypothetical protein
MRMQIMVVLPVGRAVLVAVLLVVIVGSVVLIL